MFSPLSVILVVVVYIAFLFGLAQWGEQRTRRGQPFNSATLYALSMGVYFTTWTFYGSIGFATQSGLLYLGIYVGALLSIFFWQMTLRRMIAVKETFRITSIADLISTRYRRSQRIAALVTLIAFLGLLPYISLQLEAVVRSFRLITIEEADGIHWSSSGLLITLMMVVFTILFGVRRLDPTERHQGMILALVAECVVKLVAFLVLGGFITWYFFDGPVDMYQQIQTNGYQHLLGLGGEDAGIQWLTLIVLSFVGVQLLPRQFHVAVVENVSPRHLGRARWMFPLYTVLITAFVIPVAAAGMILGLPEARADYFMLMVPQALGQPLLALLAFVGGFSAASGMVIITTMTLSTMVSNHLLLPVCEKFDNLRWMRTWLLQVRWVLVALILFGSFGLARLLSDTHMLVAVGLISFVAALQLAPATLIGLFWSRGNSMGAFLGMLVGFALWGWTLIIPAWVEEGWVSASLLNNGPFGIEWLRPEMLFGLDLPQVPHAVFWSLLANILFYLLGSWFYHPQKHERTLTTEFLYTTRALRTQEKTRPTGLNAYIELAPKLVEAEQLLKRYLGEEKAQHSVNRIAEDLQVYDKSHISVVELMEFHRMLEQVLAGSIGAASAHTAIEESIRYTDRERSDLTAIYSHIVNELQGSYRFHPDKAHEPQNHSFEALDDLQNQLERLQLKVDQQKNQVEQLETRLEQRYQEIFDYRVEAQRLRHENETLRQQLLQEPKQEG
jgi:Na+/proline symporter